MKRKVKVLIAVIIVIAIAAAAAIHYTRSISTDELTQRLTPVKVHGAVTAMFDNESISLDKSAVEYGEYDSFSGTFTKQHATKMRGNSFSFSKGAYGDNTYKIVIESGKIKGYDKDITLYVQAINSNKWQTMNFDINLNFTNADGKVKVEYGVNADIGGSAYECKKEKTLSKADSTLYLYISDI